MLQGTIETDKPPLEMKIIFRVGKSNEEYETYDDNNEEDTYEEEDDEQTNDSEESL